MENMSELVAQIEKKTNLNKKDSKAALAAFMEVASKQLKKKEKNDETR